MSCSRTQHGDPSWAWPRTELVKNDRLGNLPTELAELDGSQNMALL